MLAPAPSLLTAMLLGIVASASGETAAAAGTSLRGIGTNEELAPIRIVAHMVCTSSGVDAECTPANLASTATDTSKPVGADGVDLYSEAELKEMKTATTALGMWWKASMDKGAATYSCNCADEGACSCQSSAQAGKGALCCTCSKGDGDEASPCGCAAGSCEALEQQEVPKQDLQSTIQVPKASEPLMEYTKVLASGWGGHGWHRGGNWHGGFGGWGRGWGRWGWGHGWGRGWHGPRWGWGRGWLAFPALSADLISTPSQTSWARTGPAPSGSTQHVVRRDIWKLCSSSCTNPGVASARRTSAQLACDSQRYAVYSH